MREHLREPVALLGATGSVGSQTIEAARALKDRVRIVMMSAHSNATRLAEYANEFQPPFVALTGGDASALRGMLDYPAHVFSGGEGALRALEESGATLAMLSVVGVAGLPLLEYCLSHNIAVALANKESLVCGGPPVCELMRRAQAPVFPVDSEHAALFQCLRDTYDTKNVKNLILTASGGPFYGKKREELQSITPAQAAAHPNWSMGRKISIDSATLANKGMEVIEAHYLFGMEADAIRVLVHPQSLVHSMVEFTDSSIIAQMGPVDMRLPIQKALLRCEYAPFTLASPLDLAGKRLTFDAPDTDTFRSLALATEAVRAGGSMPAVFAMANDCAVELFVQERVSFLGIAEITERCLARFSGTKCKCVTEILHINKAIGEYVLQNLI